MKRRDFFKLLGLSAVASLPLQLNALTTTAAKIVIVGGGYSGRTAAKYLKMWGGDSVDVTIIDKNAIYTSPILSNLVLNGEKNISDLEFDYTITQNTYKVNFVNKSVNSIDKINKKVILEDGSTLYYDKLILATGIDFTLVNDYDFTKVPHAWIAGEQTTLLKEQIDTLENGDTFIMTVPKAPYRCPPGPYERAALVADYLKNQKGLSVNVIVLDENSDIIVEKDSFSAAFERYQVDYRANITITSVDDSNLRISFLENGIENQLQAKVLNVIPQQKASALIVSSGLTDSSNFAPVSLQSYESLLSKDIYIIGDAHKSSQPKAGHIANTEAKICADAILRSLNGYALYPNPKTNSACYSPLSRSSATWLSAVYEYDATINDMKLISFGAGSESSSNYQEMFNWTGNLFNDTFI